MIIHFTYSNKNKRISGLHQQRILITMELMTAPTIAPSTLILLKQMQTAMVLAMLAVVLATEAT